MCQVENVSHKNYDFNANYYFPFKKNLPCIVYFEEHVYVRKTNIPQVRRFSFFDGKFFLRLKTLLNIRLRLKTDETFCVEFKTEDNITHWGGRKQKIYN